MEQAYLYLRLSKEDERKIKEGDDSASIRNQEAFLREYCGQNGFAAAGVFKDDDYSGLYRERPAFEEMIELVKKGPVKTIISKSQSRFTRNHEHMEYYFYNLFEEYQIRFIGVLDGTDTARKETKKATQVSGLVNEWYCEDLSKSIKGVLRAKQKAGEYLAQSACYGYRKDKECHTRLVIDPVAAEVVRKIYMLYLIGYGKAKIAEILTTEGILTPTSYKQKVLLQNYKNPHQEKAKGWSYQTIHQILNNETYLGSVVQNRYEKVSFKSKKRRPNPKEEWIIVKGMHDAIISPSLWERTRELQKRKSASPATGNKGVFSGKLICLDCGRNMALLYGRGADKKNSLKGYYCKTYKLYGKGSCTMHRIDLEWLEAEVALVLNTQIKRLLKKETGELILKEEAKTENEKGAGAYIKKRLEKIDSLLSLLFMQCYDTGELDEGAYIKLKAQYEQEKKALEGKGHKTDADTSQWKKKLVKGEIDGLSRGMVSAFIEKISVRERSTPDGIQKEIEITCCFSDQEE